ncbi:MAG: exodeoxyribonuclease VII small subunit [Firmicutes bacterium]|nr:exodeoxyribonuclease VII small subunit [Bacillota bacterium]
MDDLKFEAALARLEEIVRTLEKGEAALEESLELFEEGVKLARLCHQKLDQAETKIKTLINGEEDYHLEVNED